MRSPSWIEGAIELETRRLTYDFDAAAVSPILEALGTAGEAPQNLEAPES